MLQHTSLCFSDWLIVRRKNLSKTFFFFTYIYVKFHFLTMVSTYPRRPWLSKLKSTQPHDAPRQVWAYLAKEFLSKKFPIIRIILPLILVLHLNKLDCRWPCDALCQGCLKWAQLFQRRSKWEKFTTTTTTTGNGQILMKNLTNVAQVS